MAGCEFYFEDNGVIAPDGTSEKTGLCTSPEKSCENSDCCVCNPNCYFKQLQRAKAELEQYKKSKQASYENMQEQWNNAINENRLLKAALKNKNFVAIAEENEKLKKEIKDLKDLAKIRRLNKNEGKADS